VKINDSGSIIVDYLNYSLYDGVIGNYMLFHYILSDDDLLSELNKNTIFYFKNIVNCDLLNMEIKKGNLGVYEGISGLLYFIKNCKNKELENFENNIINQLYVEIENKDINPYFFEGLGGIIIVLSKFQKSEENKIRFKKIVCQYLSYLKNNFDLLNDCGLAHGISGIILALLNIIDYGDEVTILIKLFLDKEDSLFNFEKSNWPDSRYINLDSKYMSNYWCNGTFGILLVRSLLHKYGLINIYEQGYFSIIDKDKLIDSSCNHLCCGNAGQMACLYEIGINISDEKLTSKAKKYYSNLIEISEMNFPFPQNNLSNNFSLMTGFTGVLYYYHKINYDSLLPNILLLE
jgi:lantibiotic modifying enzyme